MSTTIKDAADDTDFITALMALQGFKDKVYIKAAPADKVYNQTEADGKFATTAALSSKADTNALADKADKTYVDTELGKKADTSALNDKANTADVYTKQNVDDELAKKADANGNNLDDAKVTAMLDKLTDKVVKTSELGTKVAEQVVVDVLVPALATVGTDDDKKVYTKTEAGTTFLKTADLAEKAVVEAIFDAQDGTDKISETKIGATFAKKTDLDNKADKTYVDTELEKKADISNLLKDSSNNPINTVGDLLTKLKLGADDNGVYTKKGVDDALVNKLTTDNTFKTTVIEHTLKDPGFQNAVREVMSQPIFEIPTETDAALNWTW